MDKTLLNDILHKLSDILTSIRIERTKTDPAIWRYTRGYSRLLTAYGFERLRHSQGAAELIELALSDLLPMMRPDRVNAFLANAYIHRISESREVAPKMAVEEFSGFELLDRRERYLVDRLREESPILAGREDPDQIPASTLFEFPEMSRRTRYLDEISAMSALDPEMIVSLITQSANVSEMSPTLRAAIDLAFKFSTEHAAKLVSGLEAILTSLQAPADLHARALLLCARHDLRECLTANRDAVLSSIIMKCASSRKYVHISAVVSTLRQAGMLDELSECISRLSNIIRGDAQKTPFELTIVAAKTIVGDSASLLEAEREFGAVVSSLPPTISKHLDMSLNLTPCDVVRGILGAGSHGTTTFMCGQTGRLLGMLTSVRDSLSTNSHYNMSFLHVVESIVMSVSNAHAMSKGTSTPMRRV